MFYWDSDTATFKINKAKFHLEVIDELIANDYAFDEYDCFQYSVNSRHIFKAALAVKNIIKEKKYNKSQRRERERKYHKKSNGSKYKVKKAIDDGLLTKPDSCSICHVKGKRIFGHHEDYSKPLDVIWVCFKCHMKIHNNEIKISN